VADVLLSDARAQGPLDSLSCLRQHQRDGRHSPHRPVLVLLGLGRPAATGTSALPWSDAEEQFAAPLEEFGPTSTTGRAGPDAFVAVGLGPKLPDRRPDAADMGTQEQRQRNRVWPAAVIEACDRQSAFCGFDGATCGAVVWIEAEHVLRLVVSRRFSVRTPTGRSIHDLHGHRLQPRRGPDLPAEQHVAWHREQVFQGLALVG
jgi:hypothetical protein